jgi:predicted nucleic acid-binding protein
MIRKIVVDTNLLFLWILGSTNKKFIGAHRRLQAYDLNHFSLLDEILDEYDRIVVTPHTLAEFWNLVGENKGAYDKDRIAIQNAAVRFVNSAIEIYVPATSITRDPALQWLGLSDLAQILVASENGYDLVSDDFNLCRHAMERGIRTYHFRQIAEER